jgi:hypothetical protein
VNRLLPSITKFFPIGNQRPLHGFDLVLGEPSGGTLLKKVAQWRAQTYSLIKKREIQESRRTTETVTSPLVT